MAHALTLVCVFGWAYYFLGYLFTSAVLKFVLAAAGTFVLNAKVIGYKGIRRRLSVASAGMALNEGVFVSEVCMVTAYELLTCDK